MKMVSQSEESEQPHRLLCWRQEVEACPHLPSFQQHRLPLRVHAHNAALQEGVAKGAGKRDEGPLGEVCREVRGQSLHGYS